MRAALWMMMFGGGNGGSFDVTPDYANIYECTPFTLGGYGDLTGVTAVYIDGVICTDLVLSADKLSLTATAPCTGVVYSDHAAIFMDGYSGNVVNLFTKTEDFTDAVWVTENTTVTSNTTKAPDGTTTADTIKESTGSGYHVVKQVRAGGAITEMSASFHVKYVDCQYVGIYVYYDAADRYVLFDIANGTVYLSAQAKMTNVTITPEAEGFYRISSSIAAGPTTVRLVMAKGDGSTINYAGASKSVIAWGAQVTEGLILKPYTPN